MFQQQIKTWGQTGFDLKTDRTVLKRKTKVQTYKTMSYRMKEGRTREKSEEDIQKKRKMKQKYSLKSSDDQ